MLPKVQPKERAKHPGSSKDSPPSPGSQVVEEGQVAFEESAQENRSTNPTRSGEQVEQLRQVLKESSTADVNEVLKIYSSRYGALSYYGKLSEFLLPYGIIVEKDAFIDTQATAAGAAPSSQPASAEMKKDLRTGEHFGWHLAHQSHGDVGISL